MPHNWERLSISVARAIPEGVTLRKAPSLDHGSSISSIASSAAVIPGGRVGTPALGRQASRLLSASLFQPASLSLQYTRCEVLNDSQLRTELTLGSWIPTSTDFTPCPTPNFPECTLHSTLWIGTRIAGLTALCKTAFHTLKGQRCGLLIITHPSWKEKHIVKE